MKKILLKRRASVLIMVLWALTLLAVFAAQIGMMTRDKISFLARAERRSILLLAAKSGIAKAIAVIQNDRLKNLEKNPLLTKTTVYYNSATFRDLDFDKAVVSVVHSDTEKSLYGVTDEASRLNLNVADRESIRKLLLAVGAADEDRAGKIASAIYDWRVYGESEIEGLSNDVSYDDLQYPYPPKKANFETLDELRLVRGVTEEVFDRLINYVTIYGNGTININTASWPVLTALGLDEEQAKMAETIRRGADGFDGTADDSFFNNSAELIQALVKTLGLNEEEQNQCRKSMESIPFITESKIFRMTSVARMINRNENKSITCVFDTNGDKIVYWRER
jgi:type II secretory pathway component PulK